NREPLFVPSPSTPITITETGCIATCQSSTLTLPLPYLFCTALKTHAEKDIVQDVYGGQFDKVSRKVAGF
ncbi:MAG TPA: hypothetical protein PKB13_14255, partial [Clostridia bacterium]|nr:hypothetical protein [Clostridia bacterium]